MSDRVAMQVSDARGLSAAYAASQIDVTNRALGLSRLVSTAEQLLGTAGRSWIVSSLFDVAVEVRIDTDDLNWRLDYLIATDNAFDAHGREVAVLPDRRPNTTWFRAAVLAAQVQTMLDGFRGGAPDSHVSMRRIADVIENVEKMDNDPTFAADFFVHLGPDATFELSRLITYAGQRRGMTGDLDVDATEVRRAFADQLAIASRVVDRDRSPGVHRLTGEWFRDLRGAATQGRGLHDDFVNLFDADQPVRDQLAVELGGLGVELVAGGMATIGTLDVAVEGPVPSVEQGARLLDHVLGRPDLAAQVLLSTTPTGRIGAEAVADRSNPNSGRTDEVLAELVARGTLDAQAISIVDGQVVDLAAAERALEATGVLLQEIGRAEAYNHDGEPPYGDALTGALSDVVIDALPHVVRVDDFGDDVFGILPGAQIPSASSGLAVDPIDLSYVLGVLFRDRDARLRIGSAAELERRQLLLDDPADRDFFEAGVLGGVVVNGLNRAGLEDARQQEAAIEAFNKRADEIWANTQTIVKLLPGGAVVIKATDIAEVALDVAGVDPLGPVKQDTGDVVADAQVDALYRVSDNAQGNNRLLLFVHFERMQAELSEGVVVADLSPTSAAIFEHIDSVPELRDGFSPGTTSFADLASGDDSAKWMANLASRIDEERFGVRQQLDAMQDGVRETGVSSVEFTS